MSSAISTELAESDGLRPWQFFVLAGMLAATAVVIVATGQSAASIIILSLTVVATSLVAIGAYRALSPLTQAETIDSPTLVGGRTRAALEREKTLILRSIKELEFDYAMKKIAQSDFDEMSTRLRARAMGLMRQIDAGGYKYLIEQELNTRIGVPAIARLDDTARATAGAAGPPSQLEATGAVGGPHKSSTGLEDLGVGQDFGPADQAPAPACVTCGVVNDLDARFCKNCGTRLVE